VYSGSGLDSFFAEAVSRDGKVAKRTRVVGKKAYIYPYVPGRDDLAAGGGGQVVLDTHGGEI
jgi:hypothetical protein